jgi:hypothetical protein
VTDVVKHSFRCKYKGNETFCLFKIVVCQKGTYLFTSVFNFPTVIRFKLQFSERFKWGRPLSQPVDCDPETDRLRFSYLWGTLKYNDTNKIVKFVIISTLKQNVCLLPSRISIRERI